MQIEKELYREILEDSVYRESVINEFLQKREKNCLDIQEIEDGFFNGKTDMYKKEEENFFQEY